MTAHLDKIGRRRRKNAPPQNNDHSESMKVIRDGQILYQNLRDPSSDNILLCLPLSWQRTIPIIGSLPLEVDVGAEVEFRLLKQSRKWTFFRACVWLDCGTGKR
ncbi:hypothetical protein CEXT_505501 [Caerostris extrusa]|uniref:Uncharacterized protein n=1 Tax=Caerostris extrusa TaxID=172846 RepID=A0AAV4VLV6_CAEEX|nr:hypothetical protein CEXT_505501 [Caerostris extrusa]